MTVAISRSGYGRPSFAVRRSPLAAFRLPLHRSAWKGRSRKFACNSAPMVTERRALVQTVRGSHPPPVRRALPFARALA